MSLDVFNYVAEGQMSLFDLLNAKIPDFKITKPVRLIETFAGYGSQALALNRLGADFEHYKISEWCISSNRLYKAAHFANREEKSELSKEDAVNELLRLGVSSDGKTPLTKENLMRKSVEWLNEVIAEFKATNNVGSVCNIHAEDLGIENREAFTYLLTYSFPCQDISVAGLGKSLEKGSGTRSGLLWEIERLLNECGSELPQVLLMENVKNLLSSKHKEHFDKWCEYLESKGYKNFYKVMDSSKFGVAQHRERVFMVSILGNCKYEFPKEIPLTKVMKDYLEDNVDKKYYITTEKARTLIDKLILDGKILTDRKPRSEQKCMYCNNLLGKKGSLGMCNKHYIQYKRWGDPLHYDKKERSTVDGYYRDGKTGRREHRVIYEKFYGINLNDEEIIHHINFVKTDNDINNLWKYPNASEHIKAHREYERLVESLNDNEEIYFENGKYFKREREHLDRLGLETLGLVENVEMCSTQTEYALANQQHNTKMQSKYVNQLGFIDKGTGQHQSNTVYDSNGIAPTQNAVSYKEPDKVVEWKKI